MTVAELISELDEEPQDLEIIIFDEAGTPHSIEDVHEAGTQMNINIKIWPKERRG